MSDYKDPTQIAIEKARERASIVVDPPSGVGPFNPDPFRYHPGRVPVAHNANRSMQTDQAYTYQPLSDPATQSLHASLSPEKQAEIAEQMLKQQMQQNERRFQQEMLSQEQAVTRSRMLVFTGIKIATWIFVLLGLAFAVLIVVLAVTGWKAGSLSDTSILSTVVNFFATVIGAMFNNSAL